MQIFKVVASSEPHARTRRLRATSSCGSLEMEGIFQVTQASRRAVTCFLGTVVLLTGGGGVRCRTVNGQSPSYNCGMSAFRHDEVGSDVWGAPRSLPRRWESH